jgi:hypothetical protein
LLDREIGETGTGIKPIKNRWWLLALREINGYGTGTVGYPTKNPQTDCGALCGVVIRFAGIDAEAWVFVVVSMI